jgi:signal transduction histidine kinase
MPPNRIDRLVHDARGPLNTISVNAEVARLLLQKSAPPEGILTALQNILRECQRCNDILQLIGNEGTPAAVGPDRAL